MKKEFINPAMRVIKLESKSLMIDVTSKTDPETTGQAPERQRPTIFGDSEF